MPGVDKVPDRDPSHLTRQLGHDPEAKLLILTADLLGMCHSSNVGVYESVRSGLATGASLMVPGPWAREAAAYYRGEPVGVHLTLNAEFDFYRWRPITQAPSLLDGEGGFPRTVEDLWDHADIDESRLECRSQLERAILWGFDVSHLSTHLGALQNRPEFFDVYLELAIDFQLPIRLEGAEVEAGVGFPFRDLAAAAGVLTTDHHRIRRLPLSGELEQTVLDLAPGVTEISIEPAVDSPELRAIDAQSAQRVEHRDLVCGEELGAAIIAAGGILISWQDVRDAQRSPSGATA